MSFHQFIRDGEGWRLESSDPQYANAYLSVQGVRVRTPSRPEGTPWTVVHRKGATVIVPVTAQGNFVLIAQERVPVRATLWEFPAGQVDEATEHTPEILRAAALRELGEETGYELAPDGELIPLGHYFSSPGFTDEHCHLFLARPVQLSSNGRRPDEAEAILDCREFTPRELVDAIANGQIRDANTMTSFARLVAMKYLSLPAE